MPTARDLRMSCAGGGRAGQGRCRRDQVLWAAEGCWASRQAGRQPGSKALPCLPAHLHRQRQPRRALHQDGLRVVEHALDVLLAPSQHGGRLPVAVRHKLEPHVLVAHAQQEVALAAHQVEAAAGGREPARGLGDRGRGQGVVCRGPAGGGMQGHGPRPSSGLATGARRRRGSPPHCKQSPRGCCGPRQRGSAACRVQMRLSRLQRPSRRASALAAWREA